MNIIVGLQYGGVPSINSMRALYNFQDKPWIVRLIFLLRMEGRKYDVCSSQNC